MTQGPGLIGSLLVGLSFAKGLAYFHRKPLFGVDHLEGHIEAAFLENRNIAFPALALLVSGGHTALYLLEKKLSLPAPRPDPGRCGRGGARQDRQVPRPGLSGRAGHREARRGRRPEGVRFLPAQDQGRSLDFSFSGLKTAALRHIRESGIAKDGPRLADFLASFEEAVARALLANVVRAVEEHGPKSLVLCGGVARNKRLRARFQGQAAR